MTYRSHEDGKDATRGLQHDEGPAVIELTASTRPDRSPVPASLILRPRDAQIQA